MKFVTARPDGRTNSDVLVALVRDVDSGHTYTYDDLRDVLSVGSTREWNLHAIQSAVRVANARMLRETQRMLHSIAKVGYRLSRAEDHSRLALVREQRGQRQLQRAVNVLRYTRFDELTPAQRTLHEAHLTITSAICQQVGLLQRRQQRHTDAINNLLTRVEKLETQ